jgi:hypothetical protein
MEFRETAFPPSTKFILRSVGFHVGRQVALASSLIVFAIDPGAGR